MLGGDPLDAATAQAAGLVTRVVPDDQVEAEARSLAERFARHSAAALRAAKRALRVAMDRPVSEALAAAERLYLEDLMGTHDATEGLEAFLAKRAPDWEHR